MPPPALDARRPALRVLVCPDKFAGTLSAPQAARAIADGWLSAVPGDTVTRRPVSDGGPGFLDVLAALPGAVLTPVATTDPLGRPAAGSILIHATTAYLESAQACGLHLLAPAERDPLRATTFGLGALVTAAVAAIDLPPRREDVPRQGVRQIVVGLGGSATNDGGAGLLAALGAVPVDASGTPLPPGGGALRDCARLRGRPGLAGVDLVAATDVVSPLTGLLGASAVYGPQKGASRGDVQVLDAALSTFAGVLERDLPGCPRELARLPGAGAAGGLGAAILALGGRCESGIGLVRRLTGLDAILETTDLVITGEGSFDEQSLQGKVVGDLAGAARDLGVPCLVFAGRVATGRRGAMAAGVTASYSLVEHFGSVEEALARPAEGLRALAARAARQWSGPNAGA